MMKMIVAMSAMNAHVPNRAIGSPITAQARPSRLAATWRIACEARIGSKTTDCDGYAGVDE